MADFPFEAPFAFQEHLGWELTDWSPDFARLEMPIAAFHGNRHGLPHGGVYATLLDTVMGFSGCFTGTTETKRFAMTLSLTTQYLSRPKGGMLIAEGRRTGGGNRTFFAEAKVMDETGELCATGTGVFRYRT